MAGKKPTKQGSKGIQNKEIEQLLSRIEPAQLRKLLRAHEQGKLSVADSLPARDVLSALKKYKKGDFSIRLAEDDAGVAGEIARTFNECVSVQQTICHELKGVTEAIAKKGRFETIAVVEEAVGDWGVAVDGINQVADSLIQPTIEATAVLDALAKGDLDQQCELTIEGRVLKGEAKYLPDTLNKLIQRLQNVSTQLQATVNRDEEVKSTAAVSGIWRDVLRQIKQQQTQNDKSWATVNESLALLMAGDDKNFISILKKHQSLPVNELLQQVGTRLTELTEQQTLVQAQLSQTFKAFARKDGWPRSIDTTGLTKDWKKNLTQLDELFDLWQQDNKALQHQISALVDGNLKPALNIDVSQDKLGLQTQVNILAQQLQTLLAVIDESAELISKGELDTELELENIQGCWQGVFALQNKMHSNLQQAISAIQTQITSLQHGQFELENVVDAKGEFANIHTSLNQISIQWQSNIQAITNFAKQISQHGQLDEPIEFTHAQGQWKKLQTSLNKSATDIAQTISVVSEGVEAIKEGQFKHEISDKLKGEFGNIQASIEEVLSGGAQLVGSVISWHEQVDEKGILRGKLVSKKLGGEWETLANAVNSTMQTVHKRIVNLNKVSSRLADGEFVASKHQGLKGDLSGLQDDLESIVSQGRKFFPQLQQAVSMAMAETRQLTTISGDDLVGHWREAGEQCNSIVVDLLSYADREQRLSTQCSELESDQLTQQQMVLSLQTENLKFSNKLDKSMQASVDLKKDIDKLQDDKQNLQQQQQITALQQEQQQKEFGKLQKDTETLKVDYDALQQEKYDLNQAHQILLARYQDLQKQQEKIEKEQTSTTDELNKSNKRIEELHQDALELSKEQQAVLQQRNMLEVAKDALSAEIKTLRESKLQSDELCENIKQTREKVQEKYDAAESEKAQLMETKAELTKRIEKFTEDYLALEHDKQKLSEELEYAERERNELQDDIKSLKEELAQWTTQDKKLQKEQEQLLDKLNVALIDKTNISKELTQLQRLNHYLDDKNQQMMDTAMGKQMLLTQMIGVLREPLISSQILAKALSNNVHDHLDNHEQKFASNLKSNIHVMQRVLSDLQEYSEFVTDHKPIQIAPCKIAEVLVELEHDFNSLIQSKHLKLIMAVDEKMPALFNTDGKMLHRLLNKLIMAAVNTTDKGGISLKVRVATEGWSEQSTQLVQAKQVLMFVIADTGKGLSKQQIDHVFSPMEHGILDLYDIGLDYATAAQIMQLLGGELKLASLTGKGTVLTAYLPLLEQSKVSTQTNDDVVTADKSTVTMF